MKRLLNWWLLEFSSSTAEIKKKQYLKNYWKKWNELNFNKVIDEICQHQHKW